MKRLFGSLGVMAVAALMLATQLVQAANDKSFFWEMESGSATIYLYGSIHLANESFYPLRPEIEQAFMESDALAVEAHGEANPQQSQMLMFQHGMYPQGESLRDHIDEELYQELVVTFQENQVPIPPQAVERMRPGLLMVVSAQTLGPRLGINPESGLDMHFIKQASAHQKPIIELEGAELMAPMLAKLGPPEAIVTQTIKQFDNPEKQFQEMLKAWKAGDEAEMVRIVIDKQSEGPHGDEMLDVMLYERNIGMVEKIEGFIQKGGTYFVVVGAAHLVGDKSVVDLMEKKGYKVIRN